jgi:hypothetical protein
MKRSDFHLITIIGIISGVLLLAGGIFAATYHYEFAPNPYIFMIIVVYPYAAYSGSLLVAGAMSIFVGIAAVLLAPPEETSVKPLPPPTSPQQPIEP